MFLTPGGGGVCGEVQAKERYRRLRLRLTSLTLLTYSLLYVERYRLRLL
jgi:hypothetical protein